LFQDQRWSRRNPLYLSVGGQSSAPGLLKKIFTLHSTFYLQNDLMRVGPSISELVPCLFDQSPEIVKLARGFFTELSVKENVLFNQLSNIIALLAPNDAISVGSFMSAMEFLTGWNPKPKII
jgi:condensin complex subunit 1